MSTSPSRMSACAESRKRCLDRGGMILTQVALEKPIAEKLKNVKIYLSGRDGANVSYADVIRYIIIQHVEK